MLTDLRDSLRRVRRSPAATVAAVLTLALGVGANTAVFSVFESIALNPLPYGNADRLVSLAQAEGARVKGISAWVAHEWISRCPSLASVALYTDGQLVLTGDGGADVFRGQRVNGRFFDTLGVSPMLGRLLTPDDDGSPRADVVVLSYELWQTRFAGDAGIVGRTLTLNGAPHCVVGVLGRDFHPLRMSNTAEEPRIYAPLGYDPTAAERCRDCASLQAIGRLADGVSLEHARIEISGAMRQIRDEHPAHFGRESGVRVEPLQEHMTAALRPALWMALAAAAAVLLIACANLANLQLARASVRVGEFALRGALGASRGRLARGLLFESGIIALAGVAMGVALGRVSVAALVALAPRELPRLGEIALDGRAMIAATLAGILTALVAGIAPVWLAARVTLNDTLKRHDARETGRGHRTRTAIVIVEVSAAFILVTGTGLLLRTVHNLLAVDFGFDAARVLTMTPVVMGTPGMEADTMLRKKRAMVDEVQALPGVVATALVNDLPLSHTTSFACEIEGQPVPATGNLPTADVFWVEGDYFAALHIPLRRGRLLTRRDGSDASVVVVSQSFARRRFQGDEALGRRLRLGGGPWLTIVGIVGDVRNVAVDGPPDEAVYQPLAMNPFHYIRIVARTTGDPRAAASSIVTAIHHVDSNVPVFHIQPMDDYVTASMAQRRFALALMGAFGTLALFLAAIGLYGVLSYTVAVRVRELGIRSALGATRGNLISLVLVHALALTVGGAALGALGAALGMRLLSSLLFGVTAVDTTTFLATAAAIIATGLAACALPAMRAARVDPLVALRSF